MLIFAAFLLVNSAALAGVLVMSKTSVALVNDNGTMVNRPSDWTERVIPAVRREAKVSV